MPLPVVAPSKASAYGRSLAGIAGSNPAGTMDVCVIYVYCTIRTKGKGQDKQDKERSKDKVQRDRKQRELKNPAVGIDVFSCECCVLLHLEASTTG